MRSMRVDCGPVRIGSWDELDSYMDGSAGSVGRIMAAAARRSRALPRRLRASRPGVPARELHPRRARGLGDGPHLPPGRGLRPLRRGRGDFGAERATPALRALIAQHVARARALFAAAEPAIAAAPGSVRSGIRLACAAYGRILDRAEAAGGDVLGAPGAASARCATLPRLLRGGARR